MFPKEDLWECFREGTFGNVSKREPLEILQERTFGYVPRGNPADVSRGELLKVFQKRFFGVCSEKAVGRGFESPWARSLFDEISCFLFF